MPVGERKEPQWRNIPVPGFVAAKRDSTRQQRLAKQQRKKEEEEEERKRRRDQEEVMQILARKWNKEDQDRSSKRRRRDDDSPDDRADAADEDGYRRRRPRGRGGEEGDTELDLDEERQDDRRSSPSTERRRADQRRDHSTSGGWQSVETPRPSPMDSIAGTATPLPTRTSVAQKRGTEHSKKIAGVFGLSDSEGEREKNSREIELAARTKSARLSARASAHAGNLPEPKAMAKPEPSVQAALPSAAPASSKGERNLTPAEVHMKYAQWKATCNRKWVPMPEELRRAVEAVMGK